jgi:hypothetical protein
MVMRYNEVHGHWPLMKPEKSDTAASVLEPADEEKVSSITGEGAKDGEKFVSRVRTSMTIEEQV